MDIEAPEFWSDDLFFSDNFCHNLLDAGEFYGVVDTLHNTVTLVTDATVYELLILREKIFPSSILNTY